MTTLEIILSVIIVICVLVIYRGHAIIHKQRNTNNELLENAARLEQNLDEITAKYDNEVKHRQWAVDTLKERTQELKLARKAFSRKYGDVRRNQ